MRIKNNFKNFKIPELKEDEPFLPDESVMIAAKLLRQFDKYESVMEELQEDNIPVFWGDDADYKSKIIEFILNNSV
jgi:hypothetical protein